MWCTASSRWYVHALRRGSASRSFSTASSAPGAILGTPFGKAVSELTVGVPKEMHAGERRVAQSPEAVAGLVKKGWSVRYFAVSNSNCERDIDRQQTCGG